MEFHVRVLAENMLGGLCKCVYKCDAVCNTAEEPGFSKGFQPKHRGERKEMGIRNLKREVGKGIVNAPKKEGNLERT